MKTLRPILGAVPFHPGHGVLLTLSALCLLVGGCGQKGPLYLPAPPATSTPAATAVPTGGATSTPGSSTSTR